MILNMLVTGMLMTNCYILGDEESGEAVVIDPGGSAEKIASILTKNDLTLRYIVNTHGHFDHVLAAAPLKSQAGGEILVHRDDLPLLRDNSFAAAFGLGGDSSKPEPDGYITEGDTISFGKERLKVIHTPGHSPGSVSLVLEGRETVFVGDTLFAGSIGRTDLPGGSYPVLISSVRERLFPLGDDFTVYPGHGPETTIGREKRYNPFF